jgi:2-polyprenyl-6-methoxyphenol hydroxylase-like FAD-dependent oxidoreductase
MFIEKMHFPRREKDHPELPEDYMYWSMLVPSKALGFHEQMIAGVYNSKTARELNTMLTEEWDESVRCLIDSQDESFATKLRIISSTPDVAKWESSPCVTLAGDSIHVMSPSGAVGVATALKDAVALVKMITGADGVSLSSISAYEEEMRATAKVAIDRSFRGGKLLYGQPPLEQCTVLEGA